jgi:hypothetical protein
MDQSLVDFFHDITDEILHNSPYVEFKDIETVRKLFEVDSGRRLFAYFVSSSLNKVIFSLESLCDDPQIFYTRV